MSSLELRRASRLASLFALRHARALFDPAAYSRFTPRVSGGGSQALIGVALALTPHPGLAAGPFGNGFGSLREEADHRHLFAGVGRQLCRSLASDITMVTLGRALQGAGAISAPVMAFAAT